MVSDTTERMMSLMAKPIDLYYWPTPNGWKITIFLEEAGLPYELVPVDITSGDQYEKEFLKISPNNKMPAIVDPEGPDGAGSRSRSPLNDHIARERV